MKFSTRMLSLAVLLCGICQYTGSFTLPDFEDDEPIDEILKKASNLTRDDFDIYYDPSSHSLVTEYDIAISEEEWGPLIRGQPIREPRSAAWKSIRGRWPNNAVNFQITDDYAAWQKNAIYKSLHEWGHYTCLHFIESTTATNRIVISKGSGNCYSHIGMIGGAQGLGLGNNCLSNRIILHEIGHALGLFHEHIHPNRDDYIIVNFDNIMSTAYANFAKKPWSRVMDLGVPYDYLSVMHYGKNFFGLKNHGPTIVTKDSNFQNVIGTVKALSFGDIKTMNLMYNCSKEVSDCNLKASDCPQDGFVGKDCACWCPGNPAQYCYEDDRLTKGKIALE